MREIAEHYPGFAYQGVVRGTALVGPWLLRMKVLGTENVPRYGPAVILINHESYIDPCLATQLSRRPITFMARKTLFQGLWRHIFPPMNVFPVNQDKPDVAAFRKCRQVLAAGNLLCIFPEGTRSKTGIMQPAQPGAISIALRSHVPIIPAAVWGTYQALPPGGRLQPCPVAIEVGHPLVFAGLSSKRRLERRIIERVGEHIMAEIATLKAGLEQRFADEPRRLWHIT